MTLSPYVDTFTRAYLAAALWTADPAPAGGEYVPDYSLLNDDDISQAIRDCTAFREAAGADIDAVGDDERNGHDFLLTRNGHGAGFWERGYGDVGERLSEVAQGFGEWELDVCGTFGHRWGTFHESRLAGTWHRDCENGCGTVSLDGDDDE